MTITTELSITQLMNAMTVTVPEGESGDVAIKRFTVTEAEAKFANMRMMFSYGGSRGREIKPGTYTKLMRNGQLWMSDTPAERRDHVWFVQDVALVHCRTVLVTGLGIGMVAQALSMLPDVERVTVVEQDEDVIKLVAPHLGHVYADAGKWLDIVHGDATEPKQLETLPSSAYDAMWHDIWQEISADNWEGMKAMRRRWRARLSKPNGFQQFWCEREIKDLLADERRDARRGYW